MYQSVPKTAHTPGYPGHTCGHVTFFGKKINQIPWYVGILDGQMPHWLVLQEESNSPFWLVLQTASNFPPTSDHSKIFPCVKPFIQM